jgi:tetratricopeptide (TPR) repeat protein
MDELVMSDKKPIPDAVEPSTKRHSSPLRAVSRWGLVAAMAAVGYFASTELQKRELSRAQPKPEAVKPEVQEPEADLHKEVDLAKTPDAPPPAAPADAAPPQIEEVTGNLSVLMIQGDNYLNEANPAAALKRYQAIEQRIPKSQRPEVLLRMALAEEGVGDHRSALSHFRELASSRIPNLVIAARLGQARLWNAQEQFPFAETILFDLLLNESDAGMNDGLRGDVLHLLASILTSEVVEDSENRTLDDEVLLLPRMRRSVNSLRDDALSPEQIPTQVPAEGLRLVSGERGQPPELMMLAARFPRCSALELLAEVAKVGGYRIRGTREIQGLLASRQLTLNCRKVSAAGMLDGLLASDGLLWIFQDGEIKVISADDAESDVAETCRSNKAERALQYALSQASDHEWAPGAYIALAKLRSHASDLRNAERFLEQTLRIYPRSGFDAVAAFNLGKVRLLMGKLNSSADAFLHAVDASQGKPLEAAAYLYAGRVWLESGQPRKAINPLTRAAALQSEPNVTRVACLTLGSAYLMGGNPVTANTFLLAHKDDLADEPYRDVSSFLSALSQYRSAELDQARRARDGRALLNSLSHADKAEKFGWAISLLTAQAAQELLLDDEAERLYELVAQAPYENTLRDAAVFAIANLRWESGEQAEAIDLLSGLAQSGSPDWQHHALMQRCRLELERSNHDGVLRDGQLLLGTDLSSDDRATVLKRMGLALQKDGKHEMAAYCFAGVSPVDLMKRAAEDLP